MSSHSSMLIRDSFEKPFFFRCYADLSTSLETMRHFLRSKMSWWQVDKGTAMMAPDPDKRCMAVAYPHQDGGKFQ